LFRRAAPAKIAFIDFLDHDPKFRNEIRFGTRSANSAIVRGNRTSGTKDLLGDNVGFTGFWKRRQRRKILTAKVLVRARSSSGVVGIAAL